MATKSTSVSRFRVRSKQSKPNWKPHEYQKRAVQFMLERGAAALFLDPGLGKTSISLAAMKVLKRDGQMKGALVLAPLRVARLVWPAEAAKWKDFEDLSVGLLHGPQRDKVLAEDHDVYVTNYESLHWLFSLPMGVPTEAGKELLKKVDVLFFDELSKMKHMKTKRFKLMRKNLKRFRRRYGLTGSPAPNGLEDLFGQCYALDEGRTLGPYITHYRLEYFSQLADRSWVPLAGAKERIYERLEPLAMSLVAEDHLKLPKLRDFDLKFDIPAKYRANYEELEETLLTVIEGHDLFRAKNALSGKNLCRQFCSGFLYKSNVDFITGERKVGPRDVAWMFDDKLDIIESLVEELAGQPLLLAYEFQEDKGRIAERLKPYGVRFFGETAKKDTELEKDWNAGRVLVAAANPQSIAYGLNLQGDNAHNVCWYTIPWDYELYMQFVRRLLRQGNTSAYLNNYRLLARGTVEERVAGLLRRKGFTENDLKRALADRHCQLGNLAG